MRPVGFTLMLLVFVAGCGGRDRGGGPPIDNPDSGTPLPGIAVLGHEAHVADAVEIVEIGTEADGLNGPRDLAFNPDHPGELWVVNRRDDSTTTYFDVGTEAQTAMWLHDPYAEHFMEEVSSIAFGAPGTFGTCQESRNTYNDAAPPNDFMGPALWSSDFAIYAQSNPDAVEFVGFDLGSHLDMLHESPLCMGIAWEIDNVYWTFDGLSGTVSRYDFVSDHGPGYDDHSDGVVERHVDVEVARLADVPSHLEYDPTTALLYVADTGNARVLAVDTVSGTRGTMLLAHEEGVQLYRMNGTTSTTFADATTAELVEPSGLALYDGHLYVSDHATSRITALALDGTRVDWLDTGLAPGSIMGIAFDPEGRLYVIDNATNRVLRIAPRQ